MVYYLYRKSPIFNYKKFNIVKKSGGERTIYAPISNLKILQTKLNNILTLVYHPKDYVFGFRKGRGIKDNANRHFRNNNILNIDLKDFFPSIHFGRVRGLFMGEKFKFNKEVASTLAQICCYREDAKNAFLPQGAPTSPIVSNMICYKLDYELFNLARKYRLVYTRYADDITLSSIKYFSEAIICSRDHLIDNDNEIILGEELKTIIKNNVFKINNKKTRLRTKRDRQEVTGLVVNKKVNINRPYIKHIRAILHDWELNGRVQAESKFFKKYDKVKFLQKPQFPQIIEGRINFIRMIRGEKDFIYRKFINKYNRLMGNSKPQLPENIEQEISQCVWIVKCDGRFEGTAFMLDKSTLVTCCHVIKNKTNVEVFRSYEFGCEKPVAIKSSNEILDLAILQMNVNQDSFPALRLGDDAQVKQRDAITVCGFPDYHVGDQIRVVDSKIASINKVNSIKRFIVKDILLHGNSGGPALNSRGEVIGVIVTGLREPADIGQTLDFGIIPISELVKIK